MDLEERIIELETKASYQDHIIQELNDVVTNQQKQIDALELQMERTLDHLKTSSSQLARPDEEVPPPHY